MSFEALFQSFCEQLAPPLCALPSQGLFLYCSDVATDVLSALRIRELAEDKLGDFGGAGEPEPDAGDCRGADAGVRRPAGDGGGGAGMDCAVIRGQGGGGRGDTVRLTFPLVSPPSLRLLTGHPIEDLANLQRLPPP